MQGISNIEGRAGKQSRAVIRRMLYLILFCAMPAVAQQRLPGQRPPLGRQLPAPLPLPLPPPDPVPLPHEEVPAAEPEHISPWLIAGGLLLLLLVVGGVIMLLFGRKSEGSKAARRPVRDAMRALKDLRVRADVLRPAEVAHQVSEILRRFHEARYGIPAPCRTSQELFPNVDLQSEPLRRRVWRERYEPLAAIYDALSYAPAPASTVEAVKLIDISLEKLGEERTNEDALAN